MPVDTLYKDKKMKPTYILHSEIATNTSSISTDYINTNIQSFHLNIPSKAFITAFDTPFFDRHHHLCYVAKTASLNVPLNLTFDMLYNNYNSLKLTEKINIRIIYPCTDYISDSPYAYYNKIYCHPFTIIEENLDQFVKNASDQNLNRQKGVREFFVFSEFKDWANIKKDIYNKSKEIFHGNIIDINGGDSARRHAIHSLSVKLQTILMVLNGVNDSDLVENLNFDKDHLSPRYDSVGNVESKIRQKSKKRVSTLYKSTRY